MATPLMHVDASTDVDAAVLNLAMNALKIGVKTNWFQLLFTAATNAVTVVAGVDSDGEVIDADAVWNAGDVKIDITLSGFSAPPLAVASINDAGNASSNVAALQVGCDATTRCRLVFLGAGITNTPVDPDGNMNVNVQLQGV